MGNPTDTWAAETQDSERLDAFWEQEEARFQRRFGPVRRDLEREEAASLATLGPLLARLAEGRS